MKPLPPPGGREPDVPDCRLYFPHADGWQAQIKQGWEKYYCYSKNPDEEHFHLIVSGELYLVKGDEKLCLRCAARQGLITTDRRHWQRR